VTAVVGRPRVVPGGRWDQREIDDVIREQVKGTVLQVPWRYREATTAAVPEIRAWVDELVTQAIEECERGYPKVRHGRSLVLFGRTGTGKTHPAYGAVFDLALSGVRCRWLVLKAVKLFKLLEPRHGIDHEAEFERISTAGVLVLDDIGAHKSSEWRDETLTRLIDERYEDGRPTLYITNLTAKEFDQLVGERVASRLAECASELVIGGPDRRRQGGVR
jgi:DNA replication protein DnaC